MLVRGCERRSRGNGGKDWNDGSEVAGGNGSSYEKKCDKKRKEG